jgi:electron transfer flavoprotein beta subunit
MLKLVVCIKQVPMVSELPWDAASGTLQRDLAEGMMNPACKHAIEAAVQLKERHGGHLTAFTMGPPMAEEVLREAIAAGVDRGVLLTDRRMAGADTFVTSFTLATAIRKVCPDFDLVLCGFNTSDSETAQVGPQLAEELDVPGAANVEHLELQDGTLRMQRLSDNYLETLEMDLPGLITVTTHQYAPRYVPLAGLETAFGAGDILRLDADALGLPEKLIGVRGSPTKILDVYSPTLAKTNTVMTGDPKKIVRDLFAAFGGKIGSAVGKDLKKDGD